MDANTYCGDTDRLTSAGFTTRFDLTMARLARAVVPGAPHHVLQRGNPGQRIFSTDQDYKDDLELVAEGCENAKVKILAYCLLPKQVQLILVPNSANALRQALGEAHRRFTRAVNLRRSRGGRFGRGGIILRVPCAAFDVVWACGLVGRQGRKVLGVRCFGKAFVI